MSSRERDINRIRELLSENVDSLSEEELIKEIIEDYGSEENALRAFDDISNSAIANAGKVRLASAREMFDKLNSESTATSRVSQLTYEQKVVVLERVRQRANEFPEELTRAARGELGDETDIDSTLEDLEFLGFLEDNNFLSDL